MHQPKNMQTRILDPNGLSFDSAPKDDLAIEVGVPKKIALQVVKQQTKLVLQVTDALTIGRSFTENEAAPFIDLQLFGAVDLGVSRKHLRLWSENGELYIEDLASSNGTRLNGVKLPEYKPQRIHHGDEIALGGLVLKVEFVLDFLS